MPVATATSQATRAPEHTNPSADRGRGSTHLPSPVYLLTKHLLSTYYVPRCPTCREHGYGVSPRGPEGKMHVLRKHLRGHPLTAGPPSFCVRISPRRTCRRPPACRAPCPNSALGVWELLALDARGPEGAAARPHAWGFHGREHWPRADSRGAALRDCPLAQRRDKPWGILCDTTPPGVR